MTNEAKERAIRWLTEEVRLLRLAPKVNGCEPDNWAEQLEVMETCLEAVRSCNQVANKSQFGCNLLTTEQLREMNGQPVWVEFEDHSLGLWGIVHISVFEQIVFPDGMHCTIGQPYYGRIYKAYAYPPAHIDMEACELCGGEALESVGFKDYHGFRVYLSGGNSKIPENEHFRFCPKCGRPLTEEARAEPEKRLRG